MLQPIKSQSLKGDFVDVFTTKSKDTVIAKRHTGQWWYGITGGVNTNLYYGNLFIPQQPDRPVSGANPLINFPNSFGFGGFLGLTGEWMPTDENWGISLTANLLDYNSTTAKTDPITDARASNFKNKINFRYYGISPSFRYNLPIKGLHLLGGFDISYLANFKATYIQADESTSYNEKEWKIPNFTPIKLRAGLHLGVGYDIFAADINHNTRVYLTPFFTIQGGTNVINENGSNRNVMMGRLGVSIKFSQDKTQNDTLFYNPNVIPAPPAYLATVRSESRISFGGFKEWHIPSSGELAMIEEAKVNEEIAEAPAIKVEESVLPKNELPVTQKVIPQSKPKLKIGSKDTLYYSSPATVGLTKSQKETLDSYVEYLKSNSRSNLQIWGHSDLGSVSAENERRAVQRADDVINYLVSRGISRKRLFDRAFGARVPIANNLTEEGRRRNRRVEITIIR
jgi:outer membrane protein OmpA-like peptidoglycan-associated protein